MKVHRLLAPVILSAIAAACAPATSPPEVTSFNRAAELGGIPRGTIAVNADSFVTGQAVSMRGYSSAVESELTALGYTPAAAANAEYSADVDVRQDRFSGPSGASVGVGGGSYGGNIGIGGGLSLPIGERTDTITEMNVRIVRKADNLTVWEGRAQQRTRGEPDNLALARDLSNALFASFPRN